HIFKIVWQFSMEPEDFLTLIKEDPAGISQGDFLLVAVEQRHAKLCFNVLDRFADRRLGYIETVGSFGHTAIFHDRNEILHMFDVDHKHFLSGRCQYHYRPKYWFLIKKQQSHRQDGSAV